MAELTYRDALRSTLIEEMDHDRRVVLIGEDIGVYQGTFRVTADLLKRYGPARVIDTPISELGFVGAAIGMAMLGLRPVVEVMTWNFSLLAMDQIVNNAAKLRYFSGGQVNVPMVIRGPNGAGVQLSAQHSQSLEATYAHFPGLYVVAPATPAEAKGLLRTAIRSDDPVIFLENAALYGMKGEVPDSDFALPFGKAAVARSGRDVTVVAYSRMVLRPRRRPDSSPQRVSRPRSSTCGACGRSTRRPSWSRSRARIGQWWSRNNGSHSEPLPRLRCASMKTHSISWTRRSSASPGPTSPCPTPARSKCGRCHTRRTLSRP